MSRKKAFYEEPLTMRPGYLSLATSQEQPELVKLLMSETNPLEIPPRKAEDIRFVLHFDDIDTAFMHAQSSMSRQLFDLNEKLYKKHLGAAMGDLDSLELTHSLIWKDPDISEAELDKMQQEMKQNQRQLSIRDRFVQVVKWFAILYLGFNFLSPLIADLIN